MTDKELQTNVKLALDWEPSVDVTDIGISVGAGVVTLRGDVKSYREKKTAERVALGVYGVRAVANDLNVKLPGDARRSDSDIALAAANALKWSTALPANRITVTVSNGWLTLKGEVDWNYQKDAASRALRDLLGVAGVINDITVKPHVNVSDVESKIAAALKRSAEIDARRIHVGAADGKVVLSGNVRSWFEREEARRAAWSAPGVREVEDHIAVVP